MNNQALVCILMASYNGEKFIRQQLESIFSQTFKNWQLVISDDGSTDKTIEIILEYKKNGVKRFSYAMVHKRALLKTFFQWHVMKIWSLIFMHFVTKTTYGYLKN